ncbi:MAG: sigma-70 family RNA polymerase sigma factor [Anaerolineae bacterium]|nr:sigma-70 family RNA polymerase sigma factor [Anaerolineae bacterium]
MAEISDNILITRAQNGDSDAMANLYRRHVGSITRYIAYRVSDQAVIEDLTAEVFLRMVEGLPNYEITGAPFEAWLYRIAAARIATFYRKRERRPEEALHENLQSGQTAPEQLLQNTEELDDLREALNQLNDEQQTILILRFVERKSHEEVASVLGKSERAVATAQHRALKKLARLLGTTKTERHYIRGKQ